MDFTIQPNTTDRNKNKIVIKFTRKKGEGQLKIYTPFSVSKNSGKKRNKEWSYTSQRFKPSVSNAEENNLKLKNWKVNIETELTRRPDISRDDAKRICDDIIKFGGLQKYTKKLKIDHKPVIETSSDGVYANVVEGEILVDEDFSLKDDAREVDSTTIEDVIIRYAENNRRVFSDKRIKRFYSIINSLKEYGLNDITIEDFSVYHLEQYRNAELDKGNKNNTINTKIKAIKAPIKKHSKLHPSLLFENLKLQKVRQPTIGKKEYDKIMTSKEKLTKALEETRDVFEFSCLTGQRISDINKLSKLDIIGDKWIFAQQKTGTEVGVPITKRCKEILEKYNYKLNLRSDDKYRDNLKRLFKKLKIDRDIKITRKSGNTEVIEETTMDKWVASHMGRRFFVTRKLGERMPLSHISAITGQDLQTLQGYDQTEYDAY